MLYKLKSNKKFKHPISEKKERKKERKKELNKDISRKENNLRHSQKKEKQIWDMQRFLKDRYIVVWLDA